MRYKLFLLFFVFPLMLITQQENVLPEGDLEEIDHQQGSCTVRLTYFCMRNEEEVKEKTHFVYDAINPSDKTRYYVFTLNFVDSEVVEVGPMQAKQVWKEYEYNNFEARIVLKGFCSEFEDKKQADEVQKQVQERIKQLKKLLDDHRVRRFLIEYAEDRLKEAIEDNNQPRIEYLLRQIEELEKKDEEILEQIRGLNNQIHQIHQIPQIHEIPEPEWKFYSRYRGCALVDLDVILFKPKHNNGELEYKEIKKEEEEDPGLKLCVNNDDDNENKKRDLTEEKVEHENDLGQFWYFWARPLENAGHKKDSPLTISTNSDKIKLWLGANKETLADPSAGNPKIVRAFVKRNWRYIEAIQASEKKLDEYIIAWFGVTIFIGREYRYPFTRYCVDIGNITNRELKIIPFKCGLRPDEVSEKCGLVKYTELRKGEFVWDPFEYNGKKDRIEIIYEAKMFEEQLGVLRVLELGIEEIDKKEIPCVDGKNCQSWDPLGAKPTKYKIIIECDDCRDEIEVKLHDFDLTDPYNDINEAERTAGYPTVVPPGYPKDILGRARLGDNHAAELFCKLAHEKGSHIVKLAAQDLIEKTTNFGDPCWVLCLSEFLVKRFAEAYYKEGTPCWESKFDDLQRKNSAIALVMESPRDAKALWARSALECHHDEDLKDAMSYKNCGITECAEKDLETIAKETQKAGDEAYKKLFSGLERLVGKMLYPMQTFSKRYKKALQGAERPPKEDP